MKEIKVKVFNAYSCNEEYYKKEYDVNDYLIFEYHNQIIKKDGFVLSNKDWRGKLPKIKPLPEDIVEKTKYELDENERVTLSMLKDTEKQLKNLYDSAKRKREKYEGLLLKQLGEDIFLGERWDCNLSPFGYCIYDYKYDEPTCIFCGEPEERK